MILNKKRLNMPNNKLIQTALGTYHRGVETTQFIFYVNYEESDENASVKMFDRNRNLISDNYFASEALFEEMEKKGKKSNVTWVSKKMKENLEVRK